MDATITLPPEAEQTKVSFFGRPGVQVEELPFGPGVPLGIETVANPEVGVAGAYGAWGDSYDNSTLPNLAAARLGYELRPEEQLNLAELGFVSRHHLPPLTAEEDFELEIEVGTRLLREAMRANGWAPSEVGGVLIGMTAPLVDDYAERIARQAGIPETAVKVSIHKACDGSVAGLNLALNPELSLRWPEVPNLANLLQGKKVLVGGIEGLSRVLRHVRDKQAIQLFGNGAGIIGLIPGQTMKFLAGGTEEVFDQEGLLQVRMFYPYQGGHAPGESLVEAARVAANQFRFAGRMHEPEDKADYVVMAGLMGMVKLFVRSGVVAVRNVYRTYQDRMTEIGTPAKDVAVAIVHHANLKINQLKDKHLQKEGIVLPIPWLVSDFGNVSAASNMIAFLRKLPTLHPGDHVLFDGFGAGTYYDVLAVELGRPK